ncbi:MAG: YitT family protein [Anaerolineaceae bacterium]|nr:YitT family protein [Anaerolineaceae bacterium]
MVRKIFGEIFRRENISDFLYIILGCIVQAIGMVVFMVPAKLVSGGISGLAQVINYLTGWPIGVMTLLGNIPMLIIGWRYLGRLKFAVRTLTAVFLFSVFTDVIYYIIPDPTLTGDLFLNTIFGAVIMGVGFGLVYLGGGTSGGTDIIGRILNQRLGLSLSYSYLVCDTLPIILGAIFFGWELALYALIAVYISGKAAEVISEGNSSFRQAYIISDAHAEIAKQIMTQMEHGVTILHGAGGYSGREKEILYCVIYRGEVNTLKKLVAEADPDAFMIVGQANEVLGEGFQQNKYYK